MKRAILAFLCATIAATASAYAGTTGVLSGLVLDENGEAVAGATVLALSPSAGRITVHTDAFGRFIFLDLIPDTYTVAIEKQRFEPIAYAGLLIVADNSLQLQFKLSPQVRDIHIDPAYHDDLYVKSGVGEDIYKVNTKPFDSFPNPVVMTLMTIPGINMGLGGFPH